ncbi:GyrI-like domain-containing protein [uncultured Clostridium sp.]|uniref:AraC family transcriptional regulator n=1 Tax=uncultured Clostridium sp. TaxID=59620 RepID=UPI0025D06AB8|nr:AraC family transcriptional regulator [uncultured Clostridium sp.]
MQIKNSVINKSIDYILQHIDDDISIEDVARYCNFSKFYFSRMFKEETGLSVYNFIKSMKIDQSAVSLKIEKDKTITDIGNNFGYSSSNFSSAFNKEYNISPVDFRKSVSIESTKNPFYSHEQVKFKSFEHYENNISIRNIKDYKVLYERYIGNYSEIGQNWHSLMERFKQYINEDTLMIEKSYNDPSISSFNKSVYDLCITVNDNISESDDITMKDIIESDNFKIIQGGKFAVYRFDGFVGDIFGSFQGAFTVWLPRSRYERDDRFGLGIYRSIDWRNNRVVMDLCIPIK